MKIFDTLAKTKVYLSRAISYISILNFIMIFGTFKQAYNIPVSIYILAPVGFLGALFLGYLDYKLILHPETKFNNQKNNVKEQIDDIEKELKKVNNKLTFLMKGKWK